MSKSKAYRREKFSRMWWKYETETDGRQDISRDPFGSFEVSSDRS
ncbi:MAG: hypothetical protein ACLRSW_05070 [Christensenellaceae bacterium]